MQAVRVQPEPLAHARWLSHSLVVTTVGFLAWAALAIRPPVQPGPAGHLNHQLELPSDLAIPSGWLGVPASPSLTWRPIRTPLRSSALRDPSPPPAIGRPVEEPGNASLQPASNASTSDAPAERLVSTSEVTLWTGANPDAAAVTRVPRLALLESLGPAVNGRLPVRAGSDQASAWVDATAVTIAGAQGAPRPWDQPFAFGVDQLRMTLPYRTQLDGSPAAGANCGPASLGMILDAFGINVPTNELRSQAHRFQGTSGPSTGFLLEVVQSVAELHGLEGQDLMDGRRYRRWTLDDVRQHLRAGHPVIPQLRYRLMPGREWAGVNYDHYLVLTGVEGDDFLFSDPIPWGGRGEGRMTAPQLLRAWQNSDAPMAALAIAGPR